MPALCMFYGIIISMFFDDHNPPHFHARYQGNKALFTLSGELLKGDMPAEQCKLIAAWAVLHHDELLANWELASEGNPVFQIDPLR